MSNPPPPPPDSDEPTDPVEPTAPNPYGAPQPPPNGQPAPYGQAPPPGAAYPSYGQPEQPQGKALAITALVLAFIPCLNLVAIVLSLVVLIGKKAGKGLAIAALVISVAWAATLLILVVVAGSLFGTPIDDLKTGQCFTAEGMDDPDEGVSQIEVVSCSESHDGEVLGVKTLSADEAEAYVDQTAEETCGPILAEEGVTSVPEDVTVTSLTQVEDPDEGDHVACVASHVDGERLTEKIG
ncbi:MAG: hypothetical protein M3237_03755 [Actinomycetota bacterium]|nr:hypothetical protein [Actinomycetota bacterium]